MKRYIAYFIAAISIHLAVISHALEAESLRDAILHGTVGAQEKVREMYEKSLVSDEKCSLHQLSLKPDKVTITYGLPRHPAAGYYEIKDKEFPNASSEVNGGCIPTENKYSYVLYCPKCRKTERKWLAAHKQKDGG